MWWPGWLVCGAAVIVAVAVVVVLIGVNVAVTVDLLICDIFCGSVVCVAVLCRTTTGVELVLADRFDVDESVDDCCCSAGGDGWAGITWTRESPIGTADSKEIKNINKITRYRQKRSNRVLCSEEIFFKNDFFC